MLHVRFDAQRRAVDRLAGCVAEDNLEQRRFVDGDGCRLLVPCDGNRRGGAVTAASSKTRRKQDGERNGASSEHGPQAVAESPLFHAHVQCGAESISPCGGNMW